MTTEQGHAGEEIRGLYAATRAEFMELLESVSEEAWGKQSLNPGWTNGEILAHILFGFLIVNALLPMARFWARLPRGSSRLFAGLLNAMSGPFNWINALGTRGQAKVFSRPRIGKRFDRIMKSLLSKLNRIRDNEWQKGMYYPTKWDPNFGEFMTLKEVFYYPVAHFKLHKDQIAPN